MVIYTPNPQPPIIQRLTDAMNAGRPTADSTYGSALRQQQLQREQQAKLNADMTEQRRIYAEALEAANQTAREGRYF